MNADCKEKDEHPTRTKLFFWGPEGWGFSFAPICVYRRSSAVPIEVLGMSGQPAELQRVHLRIAGRVQGVGFRYSAGAEARRLGVRGWVRNTPDGAVELLAEGDEPSLRQLVSWCHAGPPGALVTDVEQDWLAATGEFTDFRIRS